MGFGDEGIISADGKEITFQQIDEDKLGDEHDGIDGDGDEHTNIDGDGDGDDIGALIKGIDLNAIPEDQRVVFGKMVDVMRTIASENKILKQSASTNDIIEKTLMTISNRQNQPANDLQNNKPTPEEVAKQFVAGLGMQDNDYYKPMFERLIAEIFSIRDGVAGLGKNLENNRVNDFQNKVVSFVQDNKVPKHVVAKMDEIAKTMGAGAYSNLPRLLKFAKLELGIKDNPPTVPKVDIRDAKNRTEMRSFRKATNTSEKPVTSMAEAMDKAINDLSGDND